jgi:hypothetical protein
MLILGIVAVVLVLIICIAAIVHFVGKYNRAVAKGKETGEKLREALNQVRSAISDAAPNPPQPPPNRTDTGRALTQPRPRPRPRPGSQSIESSFSNLFDNLGEQMNQAFAGVSQAVNRVTEQAAQLASVSSAIARDANILLGLGFARGNIELDQSRRSNLQHLSTIPGVDDNTIRALQRLERANRGAEHMNWGQLVREFMRMIESGELTFTESSTETSVRINRQGGAESSPGVQTGAVPQPAKEPEPEKLPPTRFEREDVI